MVKGILIFLAGVAVGVAAAVWGWPALVALF